MTLFEFSPENMAGLSGGGRVRNGRNALLAGHKQDLLKFPEKYIDIVPQNIKPSLNSYMRLQRVLENRLNGKNMRSKRFIKLRLQTFMNDDTKRKYAELLAAKEIELMKVINKHSHNMSSALRRLRTNKQTQLNLQKAERWVNTLNKATLSLLRAVREAKSLRNIGCFHLWEQTDNVRLSNAQVRLLKTCIKPSVLKMTNTELNELVGEMRKKCKIK